MPAKTALITGATGQDGTLLGEYLLSLGYRVVGVVRELAAASDHRGGVELTTADLTDRDAVDELLAHCRPDEIYHLAAYHHSSEEGAEHAQAIARQRMVDTHFTALSSLAFAALKAPSRPSLVFAGSSQMYSATSDDIVVSEITARRPATFYGHVKAWGAELLSQLRTDFGLRASTAILFNHESPLRGPRFVSRKISQAVAAIHSGQSVSLEIGNSRARVDWCSAQDVVRALHAMARAPAGRDYVVASGTLHSVEDLLTVAFGHCGLDWHQHTRVRESRDEPALRGDPRLIETTLGWRREKDFEAMIREMVDNDLRSAS